MQASLSAGENSRLESDPRHIDPVHRCTIGICAADSARNLALLISHIETQNLPEGFALSRIVVVASGCAKKTLESVRHAAQLDSRMLVIEEDERHGKADAINKVFDHKVGDYLIFINSDALPDAGAIGKLLQTVASNEKIGIATASPYFEQTGTTVSMLEDLMWAIHNESSLVFNHMSISNHSNDEMMAVRASLLKTLPEGLVNDGGYIASIVKKKGYLVKFCQNARVKIDVPSSFADIIGQRRRIIFGHFQIRKFVGSSPITLESMLLYSPSVSLGISLGALRKNPKLLRSFPIAAVIEFVSVILGLFDFSTSTKKHRVWHRYGN